MHERETLRDAYERRYASEGADAGRFREWRAVSGAGKAARVLELLGDLPADGASLLDIGHGDGALLVVLTERRPAWRLAGVEVAESAARIAAGRVGGADLRVYDGRSLPWPDQAFDAGVLSHVLEHVDEPAALLREAARVCRRVVVEVPLEANLSAARPSRRSRASDAGHLSAWSRRDVRLVAGRAGLRVVDERTGMLPRAAQRFFARTGPERLAADARWLTQRALFAALPAVAVARMFTVHHAVLCVPARR